MYVHEMISTLLHRLEDPNQRIATTEKLLDAIDSAQMTLVNLLHPHYLRNLIKKESVALTSGRAALSSLTYQVARDGLGVVHAQISSGKHARRVSVEELNKYNNSLLLASSLDPEYYISEGYIYFEPSGTSSINVWYIKIPQRLELLFTQAAGSPASTTTFRGGSAELSDEDDAYNGAVVFSNQFGSYHVVTDYAGATREFTVSPAAGENFGSSTFYLFCHSLDGLALNGVNPTTQSEVSESFHHILLLLAEGYMWREQDKAVRAGASLDQAYAEISKLNEDVKYIPRSGQLYS